MKKLFDSNPVAKKSEDVADNPRGMDIAIIGMAGRIGGAPELETFWQKLMAGESFHADLSDRRANDIVNYIEHAGAKRGDIEFKPASFFEEIDTFDHAFFRISQAEARVIYPDHRIFLEVVWHALEDAGCAGAKIRGSRTGVYLGYAREGNPYLDMIKACEPELTGLALTGNVSSVIAGRIAYFLDLKGPTMLVNTACSSSLVALHQACQAIRSRDCDLAIAGGSHVVLLPVQQENASGEGLGVESPTGITRSFDDSSDGTGGGEGSIAFILKPLEKAIQDNDRIHAVIKGSAINQDGSSLNIAAPNVAAQEDVIVSAWKNAGIDPRTIGYIEAHGTGTPIGDPIEVAALTAAFRRYTPQYQFCAFGAVKSNLGHLDAAAGAAGVIKAVLSLKHKHIVPTLHFEHPNRHIAFEKSPLYVNTRQMEWHNGVYPRRAGVSSFGLSGTNAHVVLEEAPAPTKTAVGPERFRLFPISATNKSALQQLVDLYVSQLETIPAEDFDNFCYTAGTGRAHLSNRLAIIAKSNRDLRAKLMSWSQGNSASLDGFIFEGDTAGVKNDPEATRHARDLSEQAARVIEASVVPDESALKALGDFYVHGASISWESLYRRERRSTVSLPLYPFQRKRCWFDVPARPMTTEVKPERQEIRQSSAQATSKAGDHVTDQPKALGIVSRQEIFEAFKAYFANSFEVSAESITPETNMYELGLDSISIVQVRQLIKKQYQVDIPVIDLFKKYVKLGDLSAFVEKAMNLTAQRLPVKNGGAPKNVSRALSPNPVAQELADLRDRLDNLIERLPDQGAIVQEQKAEIKYVPRSTNVVKAVHAVDSSGAEREVLSESQIRFIERFSESYQKRTARSLQFAREHMAHFANNRNVSGFKKAFRKLQYTIIADAVEGSRMHDIDGNEYVDFAMGFGVFFMGHNHPIIRQALEKQLTRGAWLGPLSTLPGEVAQLIAELAGVDRVAFYNSGTEAVMVAIRLARAATGKNKIVTFSGAYHGMFDGLLAQRNVYAENYETLPLANGILQSMVNEVYVLEYDDEASLEFIREHADTIAAVIAEPVQSRRPELQPKHFLSALRDITAAHHICFILDEIITGFRILPGGAQQFFDIQADLVTYGKVVGGGLPLGIVAGKAEYLHGIDGGMWDPLGDTLPKFDHRRTIVAGTFCHHPLAMASAKAMLQHIKQEGVALYERINNATTAFTTRINHYFEVEDVPVRVYNFGSMFHFRSSLDLKLFFYALIHRGIYVWEGATFFISTVHTDADIAAFETAIRESVDMLRKEGFMKSSRELSETKILPLTDEQRRIWLRCQQSTEGCAALNEIIYTPFAKKHDETAITRALATLLERHESLRTQYITENEQHIAQKMTVPLLKVRAEGDTTEQRHVYAEKCIRGEALKAFTLEEGMIRALLIGHEDDSYLLMLIVHQIVADGFSLNLIQQEFQELYKAYTGQSHNPLAVPATLSHYHEAINLKEHEKEQALKFWSAEWDRSLPEHFTTNPFNATGIAAQAWTNVVLPDHLLSSIKAMGRKQHATPFSILLTAYFILMHKMGGRKDVLVGVPSTGQILLDNPCLVGQCMVILPLRQEVSNVTFSDVLAQVNDKLSTAQQHRNFSVERIIEYASSVGKVCHIPDVRLMFNMDPPVNTGATPTPVQELVIQTGRGTLAKYDLFVNAVEVDKQMHLSFQYSTAMFTDTDMHHLLHAYVDILSQMVQQPQGSVAGYRMPPISFNASAIENIAVEGGWWTQVSLNRMKSVRLGPDASATEFHHLFEIILRIAAHPLLRQSHCTRVLLVDGTVEQMIAIAAACELASKGYAFITSTQYHAQTLSPGDTAVITADTAQFTQQDILYHTLIDQDQKNGSDGSHHEVNRTVCIASDEQNELVTFSTPRFYGSLHMLASSLNFSPGTNLWLIPDMLSREQILNWHWMALEQDWNLFVSTDQPMKPGQWIVCGDYSTLSSAARRESLLALFVDTWVVISGHPLTNLDAALLPFTSASVHIHVITVYGDALYCFYNTIDFSPRLGLQWIPAGRSLMPATLEVADEEGHPVPCYRPGVLHFADSNGKKQTIPWIVSVDTKGIYTLWSTQSNTISLHDFPLSTNILTDAANRHPHVASALVIPPSPQQADQALRLEIVRHPRKDIVLDPRDFLKIYFPTAILPSLVHWAGKEDQVGRNHSSHTSEKAHILMSLVRQVLKQQNATLQDNFLALGGTSIQAIHLSSLILKNLRIKLQPVSLFQIASFIDILSVEKTSGEALAHIPKAPTQEVYPLSHAQRRFWIVEQLEDKVHTSNLVEARSIQGNVEERLFFVACQRAVDKHESLRTVFSTVNGEPVQKVKEASPDNLDYRHEVWTSGADEERLYELMDKEFHTSFDLAQGPLLRVRLIETAPARFVTILVTHHIIFDGWSFDVLMQDIIATYKVLFNQGTYTPTPLPIQFKDYCVWHNQLIAEKATALRDYWKRVVGSLPAPLQLSADTKRPAVKSQVGQRRSLVLEEKPTEALRTISMASNASMYMATLASLLSLLHCYSGQTDLCIGTPVADRELEELQGQIGCLINTVLIRTNLRPDDSYLEVLARVRENVLDAFAHKQYPFDLILNDIAFPRDPSRNPLFDVGFTYHESQYLTEMQQVDDLGIRSEIIPPKQFSVKTDLWFHASLVGSQLGFTILHDPQIYSTNFMDDLLDDLHFILRTVAFRPEMKFDEMKQRLKARKNKRLAEARALQSQRQQHMFRKIKDGVAGK